MRKITIVDAIKEAIQEEMRRDKSVFMIGESIRGGVYHHTEGLFKEFGSERVLDAPIAENGIVGAAMGAALAGQRPIADLMYADFLQIAADELSDGGQWRYMQGGFLKVPAVIMAGNGGGLMIANDHSKMLTGYVLNFPGIKHVQPSNAYDAKGLLKSAIRDDNPVIFLWHKGIFMNKCEVPEEEYTVPLGKANVVKEGSDVTLVGYAATIPLIEKAAESLKNKVSVEIIDPRTIEPLDTETILNSVKKTMRLVIVDEDNCRCSFGTDLAGQMADLAFNYLDAPIKTVAAKNEPLPGGELEKAVLPQLDDVINAINEVML